MDILIPISRHLTASVFVPVRSPSSSTRRSPDREVVPALVTRSRPGFQRLRRRCRSLGYVSPSLTPGYVTLANGRTPLLPSSRHVIFIGTEHWLVRTLFGCAEPDENVGYRFSEKNRLRRFGDGFSCCLIHSSSSHMIGSTVNVFFFMP